MLVTKEVITKAIASSLLLDFLGLIKKAWLINIVETRNIFQKFIAKEVTVAGRTIAFVFFSVGRLSFCISELHNRNVTLPSSVHIFIRFLAFFDLASVELTVLLCTLQKNIMI